MGANNWSNKCSWMDGDGKKACILFANEHLGKNCGDPKKQCHTTGYSLITLVTKCTDKKFRQ